MTLSHFPRVLLRQGARGRIYVAAGLLVLLLTVACGASDAPQSTGAAEPTGAPVAAATEAPAPGDGAGSSVPEARVDAAAPDAPKVDGSAETAQASGGAVDRVPGGPATEEATKEAADAKPAATATPSVSELTALVEANPPAATPETETVEEAKPESGPGTEPEQVSTAAPERKIAEGPLAAEPAGIYAWINSEPLTLEQLRGKVVLVDFWTYTCVNCIRTFPYLKLWHSRYADDGLVILGIHTPEFEFEKNYWNVLESTQENGIVWPVAQDNDFGTWDAYNNRYWPAKYLIDQDGVIRYTHFGEGKYAETEEEIRKLLLEAGADLSDDAELPRDQQLDPTFLGTLEAEVTPELYAGYQRNVNTLFGGFRPYVTQVTFYENAGMLANFVAPAEIEPHLIFFHGPWVVGHENVKHGRTSENYEDYLTLKYSAKSVNAVLTSDSGEPYRVRITLDGEYLTEENKGADILIGEDGESYLNVEQPRLYEIIDSPAYTQKQELRMSSNSADFGLFAFTFGVYEAGP